MWKQVGSLENFPMYNIMVLDSMLWLAYRMNCWCQVNHEWLYDYRYYPWSIMYQSNKPRYFPIQIAGFFIWCCFRVHGFYSEFIFTSKKFVLTASLYKFHAASKICIWIATLTKCSHLFMQGYIYRHECVLFIDSVLGFMHISV